MPAPYVIKPPIVNREPIPGPGLGAVIQSVAGGVDAGMGMYDRVTKDREDKLKQYVDQNIQMYQLAIKAKDNKSALDAHNNIVRTYGGSELPKNHVLITPNVEYKNRNLYEDTDIYVDGKLKGTVKGRRKPEPGRFSTHLDPTTGIASITDSYGELPVRFVKYANPRPTAAELPSYDFLMGKDGTVLIGDKRGGSIKVGGKFAPSAKVESVYVGDTEDGKAVFRPKDYNAAKEAGLPMQYTVGQDQQPVGYFGTIVARKKQTSDSGSKSGLNFKEFQSTVSKNATLTDNQIISNANKDAVSFVFPGGVPKGQEYLLNTEENKKAIADKYTEYVIKYTARRNNAMRTNSLFAKKGFQYDPDKFNPLTLEYGDSAKPSPPVRPDALGGFLKKNYGGSNAAVKDAVNNALDAGHQAQATPSPSPQPTAPPVMPSPDPNASSSPDVGDYDGKLNYQMFPQQDTAGYAPGGGGGDGEEFDPVQLLNLMNEQDLPGYGYQSPIPEPGPSPRAPVVVRPPLPGVRGKLPRSLSQWAPLVQKYAAIYDVPEQLIWDTMWAESGGNARARSPVGAIGLMQLMPGTAAGLHVNPNIPEQNIEGGVKYLSQQLKRFKGNETFARAAYNAGPGAVMKYGGVPPYKETQGYVKRRAPNVTL